MSIELIYNIVCEVPRCVAMGGRAKFTVLTAPTRGRALAEAKKAGWRHPAGHDLCPACWLAGWRYQGTQYAGGWRRIHEFTDGLRPEAVTTEKEGTTDEPA